MAYIKYLSFIVPPLLAVLIYLYLVYKFRKQPYPLLFQSFLWGAFSIVLVLAVQYLANYFGLDKLVNLRRILFYSLVVVAFFSELGKFFFLRVFLYHKDSFRTPVDGIIYSVMIALGFATMNNVFYFVDLPHLEVNVTNALSAGPANLIFGVLMGFFLGMGRLRHIRFIDAMTGLAAAVLFHALYSFCLLTKDTWLLIAFFAGSLIIAFSLCIAAIRLHEEAKSEAEI
jgi:protease PrsW